MGVSFAGAVALPPDMKKRMAVSVPEAMPALLESSSSMVVFRPTFTV